MIISLIILSAGLSLLHYFDLQKWAQYLIGFPVEYYVYLCIFLIVVRIILALRPVYIGLIRLSKSLGLMSTKLDTVSMKLNKTNSPFGNKGQTRKYSSKRDVTPSIGSFYRPYTPGKGRKVVSKFFEVISKLGSLVTLERGPRPSLSSLFQKIGFRMFGAVFTGKGKFLSRMRQLNAFRQHLYNKYRCHGSKYTIAYLKAGQLAIQKAIAGTPVKSLNEINPDLPFEAVASCGLPSFIPLRDRRLILKNKSSAVIRWWLTLFAVYRVIFTPGILKLSTITDVPSVPQAQIDEVADELVKLVDPSMFDQEALREKPDLLFLETASSTSKVSWMGFLTDIVQLRANNLLQPCIDFLNLLRHYELVRIILYFEKEMNKFGDYMGIVKYVKENPSPVGKLSIKEEPAGKLRVFAMVDVWTQSILKPLHTFLFKFLGKLPNDGTMDQRASVERCFVKSSKTGQSFGYDLSAATDRLPISLQSKILDVLVPGLGPIWSKILVDRDYFLKHKESKERFNKKTGKTYTQTVSQLLELRYATGQPMGAYSSWAMLAVTHHYIAQLAALKAQGGVGPYWISGQSDLKIFGIGNWYCGYEVLGDDIVFFEENTAKEYLLIMDKLGVPINLSKSVIAKNNSFEFAKVTGHNDSDVSALSWAMFMSQPTIMGRANIALSLIRRNIVRDKVNSWIKTMSRESKYVEGNPSFMYIALATMFAKAGQLPYMSLFYDIMKQTAGYFNVLQTLMESVNINNLEKVMPKLSKGEKADIEFPLARRYGWKADEANIKQTYITVVRNFLDLGMEVNGKRYALNPHRQALMLAREVLFMPSMILSLRHNADILDQHKVLTLDSQAARSFTPYEEFLNMVFIYLFKLFYDKLTLLYQDISDGINNEVVNKFGFVEYNYTLNELIRLVDLCDRYKEILELVDRAENKLGGDTKPKSLVDSPLATLRTLVEADNPYGPMLDIGDASSYGTAFVMHDYLYALAKLDSVNPSDNLPVGHSEWSPDLYFGSLIPKKLGNSSPSSGN
jgi:hypothetical protein